MTENDMAIAKLIEEIRKDVIRAFSDSYRSKSLKGLDINAPALILTCITDISAHLLYAYLKAGNKTNKSDIAALKLEFMEHVSTLLKVLIEEKKND